MSNLDSPGPLPANPHIRFRPGFSISDGLGALESPLDIDASPQTHQSLAQWTQCWQHILRWYHSPDLEAIRVCSAVALSHYALKEKATWIFVLGPSGTGKTDLCIKSLTGLPKSGSWTKFPRNPSHPAWEWANTRFYPAPARRSYGFSRTFP